MSDEHGGASIKSHTRTRWNWGDELVKSHVFLATCDTPRLLWRDSRSKAARALTMVRYVYCCIKNNNPQATEPRVQLGLSLRQPTPVGCFEPGVGASTSSVLRTDSPRRRSALEYPTFRCPSFPPFSSGTSSINRLCERFRATLHAGSRASEDTYPMRRH